MTRIPVGEFILEELDARGWSNLEFADMLDLPVASVRELIAGTQPVTPQIAQALGVVFGTGTEFWTNLAARVQPG